MTSDGTQAGQADEARDKTQLQAHFSGIVAVLFCLGVIGGVLIALSGGGVDAPAPAEKEAWAPQIGKAIRAGLVRGRVVTAGRKGLKGVSVKMTRLGRTGPEETRVTETQTDLDGRFSLGPVVRLGHKLEFEAHGHSPALVDRVIPGADPLTVEMVPGDGVVGRATFNGEGVPDAIVHIGAPGFWPQHQTRTGPDGRFTTRPLPPGLYEIMVRATSTSGPLGVATSFEHRGEGPTAPLSFALLPAATLKLRVQDADTGAPIPGALVTIAEDVVHVLSLSQWTNAEGEIVIHGLPKRLFRLIIAGPGYLQVQPELDMSEASALVEYEASLKPASSVVGEVTNEVGTAIEVVQFSAHVKTSGGQQWLVSRDPTFNSGLGGSPDDASPFTGGFGFFSDEMGRFEIVGLPPGELYIEARKEGFETVVAGPFVLGRATSLRDLKIRMSAGHLLKGRVLGPDRQPLADALVKIVPSTGPTGDSGPLPGVWSLRHRHLVTDSEGAFEAADLPANIVIKASAEGFEEASITLSIDPDTIGEAELVLGAPSDTVSGRVMLEGQLPIAGVKVWLMTDPRKTARRGDACVDISDEGGLFSLSGCPEGAFWVEFLPPESGGRTGRSFARIEQGEAMEVSLPPPAGVKVLVKDTAGTSIPEAELGFERLPGSLELPSWLDDLLDHKARTDLDGLFTTDTLVPGDYMLRVSHKGHQSTAKKITLSADELLVSFELETARQITGGVADRYGTPVRGARVTFSTARGTTRHLRTDARGHFETFVEGTSQVSFSAAHADVGKGSLSIPAGSESVSDLVIELTQSTIDIDLWAAAASSVGISLWKDGDRVVLESVEDGSKAADNGLKRGDLVLSLQKEGGGLRFEVVREGKDLAVEITP